MREASRPLRSASRARAVWTWLVVLCSTDSKLAIRESMKRSVSRRRASASASASALTLAAISSATRTTSLWRASVSASLAGLLDEPPGLGLALGDGGLLLVDHLLRAGDLLGQVGDHGVDRVEHLAPVDDAGRRHRHRASVQDELAQLRQLLLRRGGGGGGHVVPLFLGAAGAAIPVGASGGVPGGRPREATSIGHRTAARRTPSRSARGLRPWPGRARPRPRAPGPTGRRRTPPSSRTRVEETKDSSGAVGTNRVSTPLSRRFSWAICTS